MAVLYVNNKGLAWRKHSYSAGNDFAQSPMKYYLRRVLGWKERDTKASFKFGRALEEAIEFYHNNNGLGAVEDFQQRWAAHKDNKEITYTKTEKDWANLDRCGREMIQLYAIRQPSLPIPLGAQSVFQREYSKEVFPGDENYGEIEFAGKLDVVSYVDPAHPLLVKVDWKPEYGMVRPLIVDIKTSAKDFPDSPGLAAFDKQLRVYSWLTGIRDTAFLWFKKTGVNYQKASSVTLLEDSGDFKAGQEVVVAYVQGPVKPTKKEPNKQPPLPLGVWIVANDYMIELMDAAQGRKEDGDLDTTNEAKEKKYAWIRQNATLVQEEKFTRQRLQFNSGLVSFQSAEDAGIIAGRQIVEIVNSWKSKKWPQTMGIRYPTDDRRDPYFRAFVLNDTAFKEQNFIKSEAENSFDDLFADNEQEED